jgi:ADP-heptose:LPS heptosyltransferase
MNTNKGCGLARMGGIGDDLIITTVFPALKQKYGYLEILTKLPHGIVFENNPYVDRIIYKDDNDFPETGAEDWQRWFVLRAKEYEAFYHMSHTCEFRAALFPGQTEFWRPASFRRKYCGMNYLEIVHDACEVPYHPIGTYFYPTDEEVARAQQDKAEKLRRGHDGPVVAWVCAGSRIDKRHPRAGFAIARMICELDATVILFGSGEKDRLIADEIEHQVRQHNGNLDHLGICISISKEQDTWPIRRALTQIQLCDLVITPDTGPQWAVAQLPMPKIVLLSHSSAENITKYAVNTTSLAAEQSRVPCFPCHRLHSDYSTCTPNFDNDGPACITDLSVEAIVQASRLWLADFDRARASIARPLTTEELLTAVKSPAPSEAEILSYQDLVNRDRVSAAS